MNYTLDKISHYFLERIDNEGINQGLLTGNLGLSIYFFNLNKLFNNPEFGNIAEDLIDKVLNGVNKSVYNNNFDSGLLGIGWGIEHLIQNKFVNGDSDIVLEEIDDKIFKVVNEWDRDSFELNDGLTGYLFYLINRLSNKSNQQSMAFLINKELLIHAINKLYELVTADFSTIIEDREFDLFWRFPVSLFGLIEAYKLNIHVEKIKSIIKQWLPRFEAYIPSMHINRLYMALILTKLDEIIPDVRLKKHIQILLFAIDFEQLIKDINPFVKNIRFGWPGFVWILEQAAKVINTTIVNCEEIRLISNEIKLKHLKYVNASILPEAKSPSNLSKIDEDIIGIGLLALSCPEIIKINH